MKFTTGDISKLLGGELIGSADVVITHPGKIESAGEGAISFIANPKYLHYLESTNASAILISQDYKSDKQVKPVLIKVENVYIALGKLLEAVDLGPLPPASISTKSSIASSATLAEGVRIGDFTVIEDRVEIGEGTIVFPQVYIGRDVQIGKNCKIFPGARIYHGCEIGDNCVIQSNSVVGSDGFGYALDDKGKYSKIPQIGIVILEDNVEVGANVVIDRATMGHTLIQQGAKLDNLIQVAHNVRIGADTVIAAQAGIAGTAEIGSNVVIGGQVGVAGHLKVADGTMIQAQSGIASNVREKNSKLYGSPAINYQNYLRSFAIFKKLPDLMREIDTLKNEIKILKQVEK